MVEVPVLDCPTCRISRFVIHPLVAAGLPAPRPIIARAVADRMNGGAAQPGSIDGSASDGDRAATMSRGQHSPCAVGFDLRGSVAFRLAAITGRRLPSTTVDRA